MEKQFHERKRTSREFTALSFVWRFIGALLLVLVTYNPTEYSYYHWVRVAVAEGTLGPEHFFVGALVVIGWTILVVATKSSLGSVGIILGAALIGTAVWFMVDLGILRANSFVSITWIALVCLAGLLSIGLSWSHIWRRMTGQVDVTDEHE
jgi:FtsH-binding integral membrane protein